MIWIDIVQHFPKGQRYSIGSRIENKLLDILELAHTAYFIDKQRKEAKIDDCIFETDTLKLLIHVAWEAKILSHKQYADLAANVVEIGKILGGWKKSLNSPEKKNREL